MIDLDLCQQCNSLSILQRSVAKLESGLILPQPVAKMVFWGVYEET